MITACGDPSRDNAYAFSHKGFIGYRTAKRILLPPELGRAARRNWLGAQAGRRLRARDGLKRAHLHAREERPVLVLVLPAAGCPGAAVNEQRDTGYVGREV
jgi:hypothetical protein